MNTQLQNALTELTEAGAQGLPDASKVEAAKDDTTWNGQKKDGNPWSLTKNNETSYNCMCWDQVNPSFTNKPRFVR